MNLIEIEIKKELSALKNIDWFHGALDLQDAERKITQNGDFLVRISKEKIIKFIVTTKWNGKYLHIFIDHELSDISKKLRYYIIREFFFYTVTELIAFHKVEQYPLTSGAMLLHTVGCAESDDVTRRFRRSVRRSRRPQSGTLSRPLSETRLYSSNRYSDIVPDVHMSLSLLPTRASYEPIKPRFRLSTSGVISSRMRPGNSRARTASLRGLSPDYKGVEQKERMYLDLSSAIQTYGDENDYVTPLNSSDNTFMTDYGVCPPPRKGGVSCNSSSADPPTPCYNSVKVFRLCQSLTLSSFLNLNLSTLPLSWLGPVEGALDTAAMNKVASFLLSHPNHSLAICGHLLEELHRIFRVISEDIYGFKVGYRCLFLLGSEKCLEELSIRQTTLTNFVMATIVSAPSNERRMQLILFWMKCADLLLTEVRDMFHFRSVVTAILSEQISSLKVWRKLHQNHPSLISRVESMHKAVLDGCFLRTEIEECVPDLVHLYKVFEGHDDNFDEFCQISLGIMRWSGQCFDESSTWLTRVRKQLASVTSIPFFRELVQTETLLTLIIGRNCVSAKELEPLMLKVDQCITMMANLHSHDRGRGP